MNVHFPWEPVISEIPEPVDVPAGSLNVDTSYQADAPRNPRLIRDIGKAFDLTLFGRLRVVRRANGALFVVDGRHRLAGAIRAGRLFIPCDIYNVHDIKREVDIFLGCNTRGRKVPQSMLFAAEVASGDESAIALNRLVRQSGLTVVTANTAKQKFTTPRIACVAALKSLYGHGSPSYAKRATPVPEAELNTALGLIAGLAPPNALVTEHVTLGFVWLVHNYPTVRDHAARLADIGWPRIDAAARAVGPRPKAEDAGKALLAVIDYGRRNDVRLAPGAKLPALPEGLPAARKAA